jgi:hypothetical protein
MKNQALQLARLWPEFDPHGGGFAAPDVRKKKLVYPAFLKHKFGGIDPLIGLWALV